MGEVTPRATLEQNIAAYERMQDQLEAEHMGRWVVVDNQQLIDAFDDFQAAADLVIEHIGPGSLLRQVARPPAQLPASVLCQPVSAGRYLRIHRPPWPTDRYGGEPFSVSSRSKREGLSVALQIVRNEAQPAGKDGPLDID